MQLRSMSAAEHAREAQRTVRFEVWQEQPNAKDRPYRRKTDHRTHMVYLTVKSWDEVFALLKPRQKMGVRTFVSRHSTWRRGGVRYVRVNLTNRKVQKSHGR